MTRRRSSARKPPRAAPRAKPAAKKKKHVAAAPVSARELRALKRELEQRMKPQGRAPLRWNPDPEDVQKSVAQLVLTIVEFLRQLMERQAIRRMEQKTLTPEEVEAVGAALMTLEETVREMARRFGLTEEDLNLDLGPLKLI
jgi:hypothetical protein